MDDMFTGRLLTILGGAVSSVVILVKLVKHLIIHRLLRIEARLLRLENLYDAYIRPSASKSLPEQREPKHQDKEP